MGVIRKGCMKKSFGLLFGLLAFGCSAVDEEYEFEAEAEFGEVSQAYNAPVTVNSQFGTQTGSARNRCDRTSSGQVCSVPHYNNVVICYDDTPGALSASTKSRINVLITALDGLLTTRTVGGAPLDIFGQPDCTQANTWIVKANVGSSGTASNDIGDYSRPDFNFTSGLTENGLPGEAAVVGQYQKHQQCVIRVDETDILAKGTNATQDQRMLDHAFVNAFAGCIGKGRVSGVSAFNRATSRDVSLTHNNDTFTNGELCQMNAWNSVNNGNFANAGNCGND